MTKGTDWQAQVKGMLKGELKRRHVTYSALAENLNNLGIYETEANIANKISRGAFTAVFMIQCLTAIGTTTLRLDAN